MQQYLNPLLCRFRQCRGTEHALAGLLQAWQNGLYWDSSNGFFESFRLLTS